MLYRIVSASEHEFEQCNFVSFLSHKCPVKRDRPRRDAFYDVTSGLE